MISFTLSEQQQQLKEMTNWFAVNEIRPISLKADRLGYVPADWLDHINKMGIQLNTTSLQSKNDNASKKGKEEREGNRMGVIATEEIAFGDPAIALSLPGAGLGGPPIQSSGTKEQQERFLTIFKNDKPRWGAYALTEPDAGSDASAIQMRAKRVDGGYVLNGQKIFITNGRRASWVVVFATVDPTLGRAGQRAFVVEKGTPGFTSPALAKKMGLRANETAELLFTDCFVPQENLLGGEALYEQKGSGKSGFATAMKTFDSTRPIVASMAIGIARAAYEYTLDIVKKEYPKHGKSYYIALDLLAEIETGISAARLLTWEAAWRADLGLPNVKEAAMCKAYAGEVALSVCVKGLELLGPTGIQGHIVEKLFRDVKVFDIFEGTNEIQHLIIARRQFEPYGIRV